MALPCGDGARRAKVPGLATWWRRVGKSATGTLREFVVRVLAASSESGEAAALAFQMQPPLKRAAPQRPRTIAGRLGAGSASGAVRPACRRLVARSGEVRRPNGWRGRARKCGIRSNCTRSLAHVSRDKQPVNGFVGFARACRSEALILQPRVWVQLATGANSLPDPGPQPADPVERRALALALVPSRYMTDAIMNECLAPSLADLHRGGDDRATGSQRRKRSAQLPAQPRFSVIVPLYRNLEFLRPQVAAFSLRLRHFSRRARNSFTCSIRRNRSADVRQLLQGLNILYGIPFSLRRDAAQHGLRKRLQRWGSRRSRRNPRDGKLRRHTRGAGLAAVTGSPSSSARALARADRSCCSRTDRSSTRACISRAASSVTG